MTVTMARRTGRELVTGELFERLVKDLVQGEGYDPSLAVHAVDQALALLGVTALRPEARLLASGLVHPAWQAFLLRTKDYREFCHRVAGRFLDHRPGRATAAELNRTVRALRTEGYRVEEELWLPG